MEMVCRVAERTVLDGGRCACDVQNVLPCVLSVYLANGGGWVIMRSWPQPYMR